MRFSFILMLLGTIVGVAHASDAELTAAIQNVRSACGGIGAELSDMKKMAGINTAVTGVGTVAGGVALGTGIAKMGVDEKADELEAALMAEVEKLKKMDAEAGGEFTFVDVSMIPLSEGGIGSVEYGDEEDRVELVQSIEEKQKELDKLTKKSEVLGDVRTGSLATATVANIAGAVIAGNNRVKGDLKAQIDECLMSVKTLSNVRMQARMNGVASDADLQQAENIVRACDEWSMVDISSINKKSSGATISSGIGATLGLTGTVTSVMANSDSTRADNSDAGKAKEKNLNLASNILAGGTTVAGGVATVFNATQISAIKRAVTVADKCEEALR